MAFKFISNVLFFFLFYSILFDDAYIFVELNGKPAVAENTTTTMTMEELCNIHADRRDTYSKPIKQPNPNKITPLDPNKEV